MLTELLLVWVAAVPSAVIAVTTFAAWRRDQRLGRSDIRNGARPSSPPPAGLATPRVTRRDSCSAAPSRVAVGRISCAASASGGRRFYARTRDRDAGAHTAPS
jgi:hypothetical protein